MPKKLNTQQNKAFNPENLEFENPSFAEAVERLKKGFSDITSDFISGTSAQSAVSPTSTGKYKYESDRDVLESQRPMLGEMDSSGLSIEEIQKLQETERKKKALEDYAAQQKSMQEPPMEVPKTRAEAMDPRLENSENYKRFQSMVQKLKNSK